MTRDDDSRAAMPLALVIEGELDFRADPEGPLREQADPLGRPLNVLLNEIDRIRKTNRYTHFPCQPVFCFGST